MTLKPVLQLFAVDGQDHLVDLELEADMKTAAESDELEDAVNYQHAYKIVRQEMKIKSKLLENIAKRILDSLYAEMTGIKKASVTIRKMNPPMGGKMERVSVTLSR